MYKISDISINIISFNREEYILSSVNSLINQSIGGFNINVFDNCSSDRTIEKLDKLNSDRIKIYTSKFNIGGYDNFKRAVNKSNKKFTIIFHDDDIIHPNYLEYVLIALNENPKATIVCSGMKRTISPNLRLFNNFNVKYKKFKNKSNFIGLVYLGFPMCFPSCLYKTDNLKKAMFGKEKYGKLADRPIIFDSILDGDEVILFPGQYVQYRVHPGQDSNTNANGPFPDQIFELQKLYYNALYLNSDIKNKLIFLTSFYHYMSLDFKKFPEKYNSKQSFIFEFVRYVKGDKYFVLLSKSLNFLKVRFIFKIYRLIKRNIGQYS